MEVCIADHKNDPTILMRWLSNKPPEIVAWWITDLSSLERGTILAVGLVNDAGEITRNYVSSDASFVTSVERYAARSKPILRQFALHAHQH
jgi:hypothetical protein